MKHRLVEHLNGALGLGDRFEVFANAPVTFVQKGDDPSLAGLSFPDPSNASFGDLTLGGSLRVLGDDLDPVQVVKQVPALAALLETREKLRDLMSKADRSQELENLLEQVLRSEEELKSLSGELGIKKSEE